MSVEEEGCVEGGLTVGRITVYFSLGAMFADCCELKRACVNI